MLMHSLWHKLGSSLWLVPLLRVLASIALTLTTSTIDRYFDHGLIPQSATGNPNATQTNLCMIAASMVTLISVTLTLTPVLVPMAMGYPLAALHRPEAQRPAVTTTS